MLSQVRTAILSMPFAVRKSPPLIVHSRQFISNAQTHSAQPPFMQKKSQTEIPYKCSNKGDSRLNRKATSSVLINTSGILSQYIPLNSECQALIFKFLKYSSYFGAIFMLSCSSLAFRVGTMSAYSHILSSRFSDWPTAHLHTLVNLLLPLGSNP